MVRSLDLALPVRDSYGQESRKVPLRVVARLKRSAAELLIRLRLEVPVISKMVQNVVERNR
ncbi:MAG TPA: hypothetical protein VEC99_17290 [Clostridia bacterium]|nr:hypothetical protein [Clostridia bacterium]